MKIDFDKRIADYQNVPFKTHTATGRSVEKEINGKIRSVPETVETPLTLGAVAFQALNGPDGDISGSEKYRRWKLSIKCAGGEVELDPADIKFLKERIGESCPTCVVGPAWNLLDPNELVVVEDLPKRRPSPPTPGLPRQSDGPQPIPFGTR